MNRIDLSSVREFQTIRDAHSEMQHQVRNMEESLTQLEESVGQELEDIVQSTDVNVTCNDCGNYLEIFQRTHDEHDGISIEIQSCRKCIREAVAEAKTSNEDIENVLRRFIATVVTTLDHAYKEALEKKAPQED